MERKRTIEDARYFVSPSPWQGAGRMFVFIVLTVFTVLAAIAIGELVIYAAAAGVELLWVFLASRAKDDEKRIDDENTLVLYGPEEEELLDDFTMGELFYENKLILGQKFLFGYILGQSLSTAIFGPCIYKSTKEVFLKQQDDIWCAR